MYIDIDIYIRPTCKRRFDVTVPDTQHVCTMYYSRISPPPQKSPASTEVLYRGGPEGPPASVTASTQGLLPGFTGLLPKPSRLLCGSSSAKTR